MLIVILIVLIVLGLALYAVQMLPFDGRILMLIQVVMIVIAILYIVRAAGLG